MLADLRKLLGHIPKERRQASTWQYVQATLREGNPEDVSAALRVVLQLEGMPYTVSKQRMPYY